MGGEDGVHLEVREHLLEAPRAVARLQISNCCRQRFRQRLGSLVPLAQNSCAMVLFGEVGEMEVAGERPRDRCRSRHRPGRDQFFRLAFVGFVIPRSDHRPSQELDVAKQRCAAEFGDDLAEDLAQHADVAPELRRYFLPCNFPPSPLQGGGSG